MDYGFDQYPIFDPTFIQDLLESDKHVRRVAQRLRDSLGVDGPPVEVLELQIRSPVFEFRDDGDLRVGGKRVECKRRNLRFSGPDDFPFPTCIVDVTHTYDAARATETPIVGYVIDSQNEMGCVCVLSSTFDRWRVRTRYDRAKQRHRRFYEVDTSLLCTFDDLVVELVGGMPPLPPDVVPRPVCFFEQFRD